MPASSRGMAVGERSRILGWARIASVYSFIAVLVVLSRPTPPPLAACGALVLLGEALRVWAAGHLVKSARLATSGPYAYTQNPLYLGRLLILTGLAVAARSEARWNLAALAVGYAVFFLYYLPRKLRVEGARLARLHGPAFETYRARVPILFPGLSRYPGEKLAWSFGRMVRNQEPLVIAGLLVVFAFLSWKTAGG